MKKILYLYPSGSMNYDWTFDVLKNANSVIDSVDVAEAAYKVGPNAVQSIINQTNIWEPTDAYLRTEDDDAMDVDDDDDDGDDDDEMCASDPEAECKDNYIDEIYDVLKMNKGKGNRSKRLATSALLVSNDIAFVNVIVPVPGM